MDRPDKYDRPSPLRNSKAVNRPFQSPLRSVLSPSGNLNRNEERSKNSNLHSSPYSKKLTTPRKRISHQPQLLATKISQENKGPEIQSDKDKSINEADLKKIRDRVSMKKRELEHMKQQMSYNKKHESKDLENLIQRWLQGCQEALTQFHKDISQQIGNDVDMTEILAQLGIPANLVKYSIEDCDFV